MNPKMYPLLLLTCLFILKVAVAQQPPMSGFGGFHFGETPVEHAMSKAQLDELNTDIQKNIQRLKQAGKIGRLLNENDTVQFGWPLRQAAGFNDPGYYGISNYLDWNTTAKEIGDYNCGKRTYDGHRGTDIYTWPFGWTKMKENAVEVIAGADGVIVAKYEGNPDTSCVQCDPQLANCQWNAVFVRSNIDGTVAFYGHLKKNSLTTKVIGDPVAKGEYLGVVGSSGNSSGPHLHFEVWLNGDYKWLYDPWAGTCNLDGNRSLWENQQPYYNPGIIKVATASGEPVFSQCYIDGEGENPKYKNSFSTSENVYFTGFIRDNIPGRVYYLQVLRPNGTTLWNWTLNAYNQNYSTTWFYYFYPGTNFNIDGTWKFRVTYGNQTEEHEFVMSTSLPLSLQEFAGKEQGKQNLLYWVTSDEQNTRQFVVERSANGRSFEALATVQAKGDGLGAQEHRYEYFDVLPQNGNNFYRLLMQDKDGKQSYSKIINLNSDVQSTEIRVLANPVANHQLRFVTARDFKQASVRIVDQLGRIVVQKNLDIRKNQQSEINVGNLTAGKYYLQVLNAAKQLTTNFVKQ
jgi:murein DD-endopeptidase MepM/ murein hydrolase activator NlpD